MIMKDSIRAAPEAMALGALVWTLEDEARARRLLDMTGLTPGDLRGGLGNMAVLAALLRFLEAHEPDLVACAEHLGVSPLDLVAARRQLES
jgi:hypothetical protein